MRHFSNIITQPTLEPLDLASAKQWLRVDGDDQDTVIRDLIRVAREECENYTGRATYTTTYRDSLDRFPGMSVQAPPANAIPLAPLVNEQWPLTEPPYAINLMRSPVIAVSSIQYYDADGTLQTLSSSAYYADTSQEPGRVTPAQGYVWPATQLTRPGAVLITYTAGYASREAIPAPMVHAMRMMLSHWYENREAVLTGTISKDIEFGAQSLLDKVRVAWQWW